MQHRPTLRAAVTLLVSSVWLSACASLPTLPNDAADAAGPQHPQAEVVHGQAQTGQFQ